MSIRYCQNDNEYYATLDRSREIREREYSIAICVFSIVCESVMMSATTARPEDLFRLDLECSIIESRYGRELQIIESGRTPDAELTYLYFTISCHVLFHCPAIRAAAEFESGHASVVRPVPPGYIHPLMRDSN